jgi:murein DD-endopeptidase MepM/ murein hydrolase activator NlpD
MPRFLAVQNLKKEEHTNMTLTRKTASSAKRRRDFEASQARIRRKKEAQAIAKASRNSSRLAKRGERAGLDNFEYDDEEDEGDEEDDEEEEVRNVNRVARHHDFEEDDDEDKEEFYEEQRGDVSSNGGTRSTSVGTGWQHWGRASTSPGSNVDLISAVS